MSSQLCPHCGANRQGMSPQQPCWRCGRLPSSAPTASVHGGMMPPVPTATLPPVSQPLQSKGKRYIPRWLGCLGTLGILAFIFTLGTMAFLFLTAEENQQAVDETQSAQTDHENLPALPNGSITQVAPLNPSSDGLSATVPSQQTAAVNLPTIAVSGEGTAAVEVGPFAETAVAMQGSGQTEVGSTGATLLPSPSIAPSITPPPPSPFSCAGAATPRLLINQNAEVVTSNTVRVRDKPTLNGNVLVNIRQGESVLVLEGPVCADTFVWWRVQLSDNRSGWLAEGNQDQYFLAPR